MTDEPREASEDSDNDGQLIRLYEERERRVFDCLDNISRGGFAVEAECFARELGYVKWKLSVGVEPHSAAERT